MREYVRTTPGMRRHIMSCPVRPAGKRGALSSAFAPRTPRSNPWSALSLAKEAAFGPRPYPEITVRAQCDEGGTAAQRAFALCARCGKLSASPRCRAAQPSLAKRAGRPLRRADGGAEVIAGLRKIAGTMRRISARANLAISGLAAGSGVSTA